MSIGIVYYGVSYGSVDLGWNRYLTFALTSFVELPSNYVAIFALDRYATNFVIHIHAAID